MLNTLTNARVFKGGGFRIYADPADQERFAGVVPLLDELLGTGDLLKDSRTTTAGIFEVPGFPGKVFVKRTNNKDFAFTCRYLFRRARVFRAAETTFHLQRSGVLTPGVLAVGERRTFLRLDAGFLITEAISDGVSGENAPFPVNAAVLLRKIHESGVFHGDAKIQNFYYQRGRWGVWDLDGSRWFSGPVPEEKRVRDLARLALSLARFDRSDLKEVCAAAAERYGVFSGGQLEQIVQERFIRHRKG